MQSRESEEKEFVKSLIKKEEELKTIMRGPFDMVVWYFAD